MSVAAWAWRCVGLPSIVAWRSSRPVTGKLSSDRLLTISPTGNPGMASGGTGDVLTGMIAGLIAQGLLPFEAAAAGTYLHGLAGDLAVRRVAQASLLAGDVLDSVPAAIAQVSGIHNQQP